MKKAFFFVAIATLFLLSCEKENAPVQKAVTFTAGIENLSTKATMSGYDLVWSTGDKIGIYDNGNKSFTLDGDGGSTTGTFVCDDQTYTATDPSAAFFPWNGSGSSCNNVYNGTVYFKLPEGYDNYTSGQMLTPLVAKLNNSTDPIEFKHAGAAVKVTVKNLPAGVKSIGMYVDGQQVRGNYQINPASAGSASMTLDGDGNTSYNDVWLNFAPSDTEREFKMYNSSNTLVWSKTTKAQSSLRRGEVLEMPELTSLSNKVKVGIISYLLNELSTTGYQVHCWGTGVTDTDIDLVATTKTVTKRLGNDYWENQEQTFTIYTAEIPVGYTNYKVRNGDRWFGENGSIDKPNAYIFNYSGDKAIYE